MQDSNGQCHPQRNRSRQTVPKGEMNSLTRAFGVRTSTKRSNKGCNGSLGGVLMHKILEGSGNGVDFCLCLQSDENGDRSPSVCLTIGHDCYFSGYKN